MLQLKYLALHKNEIIERLKTRNFDAKPMIDEILDLDDNRRKLQLELDNSLAEANRLSKMIGALFQSGKKEEALKLKEKTSEIKSLVKKLSEESDITKEKIREILIKIPNVPHLSVPAGNTEDDNIIVFEWGNKPKMPSEAQPHWELAQKYDIIDFELGSKVCGAGFPFYKGKGAKLQRALISFFLDRATEAGYYEVQPPLLVNEASGFGTGQLPDKEGQMYELKEDKLYLIPTAEVPVTNIFRDAILADKELPTKYTAYSICFRREAGSYGSHVRGLNRLHQFDKVEIIQITHPDKSYEALEKMKNYVASLVQDLELPFRIVRLCGGDLGFTSALTYDFEVYSAAQKRWLEVSSVSNFESFQANRLNLRFKNKNGKTQLPHTLNGSALALPRIVAALLENNQTKDGIKMPKALIPYTGFSMV